MKIGVIGAGTMGQGIAKAFAQVEGNTVALCDIKQEWAENGLANAFAMPWPMVPAPITPIFIGNLSFNIKNYVVMD